MVLVISSVFGGIASVAMQYLQALAARAAADPLSDSTEYSYVRTSRPSYFKHHARALAHAAVAGDADCMLKVIDAAQRRMEKALKEATTAGVRRAAERARLEAQVAMDNAARPEISPLCGRVTAAARGGRVPAAAIDAMVREVREEAAADAAAGPTVEGEVLEPA